MEPLLAGIRGEILLSRAHYVEPVSTAVQSSNQDPSEHDPFPITCDDANRLSFQNVRHVKYTPDKGQCPS
jgi:hypothetical protein